MKGDIFIHAGDFTDYGIEQDFIRFFHYLDKLSGFRYKIVIAGNHEISLDNGCINSKKKELYLSRYKCSVIVPSLSFLDNTLFTNSKRGASTLNIKRFK